jgi:hypothetical protein
VIDGFTEKKRKYCRLTGFCLLLKGVFGIKSRSFKRGWQQRNRLIGSGFINELL